MVTAEIRVNDSLSYVDNSKDSPFNTLLKNCNKLAFLYNTTPKSILEASHSMVKLLEKSSNLKT